MGMRGDCVKRPFSSTCAIERCADKPGVSVRTVQTRLDQAGSTFSDLLESQRLELAKTYLQQRELSLDEVAIRLGYTEQSSFGRAFKRWTGLSPSAWRRGAHNPDRR